MRRSIENSRREEEEERHIREAKKNADSKFDKVMVALDELGGYDELKKIRISNVLINSSLPDQYA